MKFYLLYKIAQYLALFTPVKFSYWLGARLADIKRCLSKKDTQAVKENLSIILGNDEKRINECAKHIFRNFAKYLVDFFRFAKINEKFIKNNVTIKGKENVDEALKKGKGVILVTAHIGNWELGGVVAALLGYNFYAVALDHKNTRVNRLFVKQREMKGVHVISTGVSVRKCFSVLKNKNVLALLGDRNFGTKGISLKLFDRLTPVPSGPAYLSTRLGSPIVPGFFVRDKDDKFTLFFEKPIYPDSVPANENNVEYLTKKYLRVFEHVIRKYPDQWYVFRRFWEEIKSWESEF